MKRSLIASMVFAAAALGSSAAMAQTGGGGGTPTPPSTPTIGNSPQVLDLTGTSGFFGDALGANNNGATFSDRFTFSVAGTGGPQNFDGIVSSISRTAATGLDITGLSLYQVGGGTG